MKIHQVLDLVEDEDGTHRWDGARHYVTPLGTLSFGDAERVVEMRQAEAQDAADVAASLIARFSR